MRSIPPVQLSDYEKACADDKHQVTIEIWSHRSGSSERTSRSSASYISQKFSAGQVTSIVRDDFSGLLVLFPFLPYAVSLSLSFTHYEMRHNKVPLYRAPAQVDLKTKSKMFYPYATARSVVRYMRLMGICP